ncbi:MAG: glycosyltransferase family 1 protein [Pseudomonadota bacterium]
MRARLHWVSPLPPAETDIAHYTRRILPALLEHVDVVLWSTEPWDPEIERLAPVRHLDADAHMPFDLSGLPPRPASSEMVVYQIGNSWLFHAGILKVARRVPGCVVLHDLGLQDLAWMMLENGLIDHGAYRAAMAAWYGREGREASERILAKQLSPAEAATRFPLFEIALPRATAVLIHTDTAFKAVTARKFVPAYQTELPFAPSPAASAARASEGPLKLVQFGYMAPNRRLDSVLEALAGLDLAFELGLYGQFRDEDRVRTKIARLGLSDKVRFNGFVAEEVLDDALRQAHLAFNLRHPTMGEASGSQLRIWNAAAAAAVTDQGWYGALPDEVAFKIPVQGEREALQALLRRLDAERGLSEQVGAAGRARLEALHTPERYASAIAEIAANAERDTREALLSARARALLQGRRRPALLTRQLAAVIGGDQP